MRKKNMGMKMCMEMICLMNELNCLLLVMKLSLKFIGDVIINSKMKLEKLTK